MNRPMKWIICLFKGHDYESFESRKQRGFLFGRWVTAKHYKCERCNHVGDWVVTESINLN